MQKIGFILTLLAAALPTSAKQRQPDKLPVYKTVANDQQLRLHIFNPEGFDVKDKRPCVVFFFGGGWVGGNPQQFYPYCIFFNSLGFVAISAEYRVKKIHKTTPFECVADGKSAVRWIREHAQELGVDPDRIIAGGGSAGGHIAVCTGVIDGHNEPGEDLRVSSKPNAMVLFNPVLDTTEKGYGLEKVGEPRKTEISPCHHIRSGIPPVIVFHGTADQTVPFENAERFARLMTEAGNDCTLEAFKERDHGFFCRGEHKMEDLPIIQAKLKAVLSRWGYLTQP